MKKTALLILALLISQQVWGQSGSTSNQVEIGLSSKIGSFDLNGPFVSRTVPTCIEGCWISDSKPSLQQSIGIEVRFRLSEKFRASSGFTYSRNSYYEEFTGNTGSNFYTNLTKRYFDFLNIPLTANVSFHTFSNSAFTLFGEVGFISHINMTTQFPDPESNIELEQYGLSGSAGAGLRLNTKKYIFEIGPYLSHSLTSFGNDINPNNQPLSDSSHPFTPYSLGINISVFIEL